MSDLAAQQVQHDDGAWSQDDLLNQTFYRERIVGSKACPGNRMKSHTGRCLVCEFESPGTPHRIPKFQRTAR